MFLINAILPAIAALFALLIGLFTVPNPAPTPEPAPAPIVIEDEIIEHDMYGGYRYVLIDETTLEVSFWHPNGCPPQLDANVTETPDAVTVTFTPAPTDPDAELFMCHQAFTEVFYTVDLEAPLGNRDVIIEGPLSQRA